MTDEIYQRKTVLPDGDQRQHSFVVPCAGRAVGRFELREIVGRGGMGEVWKAHDPRRNRPIVIKFLPPFLRGNLQELERIRISFQRVETLQHQHICPVYDFDEDPDLGPFLVMKFIEGVTLSRFLSERKAESNLPTADEVHRFLKPIADALDYSHRNGVIHRDIKPDNIMVTSSGDDPQLVDFGLADEIRGSLMRFTGDGKHRAGTLGYMAPEMFSGQRGSEKSDQYSFGVVAYELLSGILPFQASDPEVLRLCVLNEPVSALPQSNIVNKFLSKVLAKLPDERYESCLDAINALKDPAANVSVTSRRPFLLGLAAIASLVSIVTLLPNDDESRAEHFVNSVGMRMVLVKAGTFLMGSPDNEDGHSPDELQQSIKIANSFYIGSFEVSQAQYQTVMQKNPSHFSSSGDGAEFVANLDTDDFPVEGISWLEANEFCKSLSDMPEERSSGRSYRLPYEHEWEYACRAETQSAHAFAELNASNANFGGSVGRPTKVGAFPPNQFQIYDCHGNVWEWCHNWYTEQYAPEQSSPQSGVKTFRGGDWKYRAAYCRSAYRERFEPDSVPHQFTVGMRVVCEIE